MKLFGKQKIVDERIENTQNKIYREAFILAILICVLSVIVKFYLYGVNYQLVIVEFLVITIPTFYSFIRTVWLGIYSDEIEIHDRISKIPISEKNILIGLGIGIAIALFFGIRSSVLYGNDTNRLWYFAIVFFASLMIYCPLLAAAMFAMDSIAKKISKRASLKDQD